MSTENIVTVRDAVKKFKATVALDHVGVDFEKGKIHGIIGRNGSGKSVLFKCITGFMALDSGEITVMGEKVRPLKPQNIGITIEHPGFIASLSAYKNLKLLAGIKKEISDARIKEVIETVGLDPMEKKGVGKYSMGMKQRLAVAQAIMESPPLLIIDEPMNGLDKSGVGEIRLLLKKLRDGGTTVLIASHYAGDIDELCDTVCEMELGKLTKIQ